MENKSFDKKFNKRILTILIGIVLVIMLIAGSYAAFFYNFKGNDNLINVEPIELELLESDSEIINLENAFPMSDKEGMKLDETFDFQIKTNAFNKVDISYGIYIEKLEVDGGYLFLKDDEVKVYLTNYSNNSLVEPVKISNLNNYLLYQETNSHNSNNVLQKDKYRLRIWIDEAVDSSDWNENTKIQYKFKIGVRTVEPKKVASTLLMSKVGENGLEVVSHEADSSLQIGTSESLTEYRFRGGNDVVTNNYVYFNCDDIKNQSSTSCELYRIIGVFPVDDGTGKIEYRVKLIKSDSYGYYLWDSSGSNNWGRPATLNTEFNINYWNLINEEYQGLVGDAKFYLGGYSDMEEFTSNMYRYERMIDGNDYYYNGNSKNWIGKIALMYVSDYGYGASSSCSDSTTVLDYDLCSEDNWLYFEKEWTSLHDEQEWLLNHVSNEPKNAYFMSAAGGIDIGLTAKDTVSYASRVVRPVFYLTSDAEFVDGDGSIDDPYRLF